MTRKQKTLTTKKLLLSFFVMLASTDLFASINDEHNYKVQNYKRSYDEYKNSEENLNNIIYLKITPQNESLFRDVLNNYHNNTNTFFNNASTIIDEASSRFRLGNR